MAIHSGRIRCGLAIGWILLTCVPTNAQIAHDGSLGAATSYPADAVNINILPTLGKRVCNADNVCNLFHSFDQFNINAGQIVTFEGPTDIAKSNIANVLARVTGGDLSRIYGILNTLDMPIANFFLMNPNGVIFGPGARLDVGGSFAVTTANEIVLADGGTFAATVDPTTSVLTTASPVAFGFLDPTPRSVQVDGATLEVPEGKTLSVIGGNTQIDDDGMTVERGIVINDANITAPSGRVTVVGVASSGEVHLDPFDSTSEIAVQNFDQLGDIHLTGSTHVNVDVPQNGEVSTTGGLGGQVVMRANNLNMTGSVISAHNTGLASGGTIDLVANQQILLHHALFSEPARIESTNSGTGDGVAVLLTAHQITINGHVIVEDNAPFFVDSFTGIFAKTIGLGDDAGDGGNILLDAKIVELIGGGAISAATEGTGQGGGIQIMDANRVLLDSSDALSQSVLSVQTAYPGPNGGDAGNLTINTQSLEIINSALINTTTIGSGRGGNIDISADHVLLDHGGRPLQNGPTVIAANSARTASNDAGDIRITATETLRVLNGAQITTSTETTGNGGNIDVHAKTVELDGQSSNLFTGLAAQTRKTIAGSRIIGAGGNIEVYGKESVTIVNGARISTESRRGGDAGDIKVVTQQLTIDLQQSESDTGLFTESLATNGRGGDIHVDTSTLDINNGGQISAASRGSSGRGGTILIEADEIHLDGTRPGADPNDVGSSIRADTRDLIRTGADLSLTLDITHTFDGDIVAFLISPSGTQIFLFGEIGGEGQNFSGTTIDDLASFSILPAPTPFTGEFQPQQPLSDLEGEPTNGVWALALIDTFPPEDDGTLNSWSLKIGETEFFSADDPLPFGTSNEQIISVLPVMSDPSATVMKIEERTSGSGAGGNVILRTTGEVELTNGANILTNSTSLGDAGVISINAANLKVSGNSRIESTGANTGAAGEVSISAGQHVLLNNLASLSTSAEQANAGNINIVAGTSIELTDSTISAESGLDGGNISLNTSQLVLLQGSTPTKGSKITAEAKGNGGNIAIDPVLVNLKDTSVISANAVNGDGGNILIATHILGLSPQSRITASSQRGVSGVVNINGNLDLAGNLVTLPTSLLAVSDVTLQPHCAVQFSEDASSFTIISSIGLPLQPGGWWPSFHRSSLPEEERR